MSNHGVTILEQATSFAPPVTASAALPIFIGTAPVHRTANPAAAVQKAVVAYSYAEAVSLLGFSNDWKSWTLCEAMDAHFRQFNVSPAVFINVFDPDKAPEASSGETAHVRNGYALLENELAILSSIEVKTEDSGLQAVADEDYIVAPVDGGVKITVLPDGLLTNATSLSVSYQKASPASVTSVDIIGGVDPSTGKRTGIELVDTVFPRLRLIPGNIAAPGWNDVAVSQMLTAKARSINGLWKAMAVVDIPDTAGMSYRDIPAWKETNNLCSEFSVVCWPRVTLGGRTYHLSTQLCGLMARTDYENGDIPFHSPSNQALQMDGMAWLGQEVDLDMPQANYLGENGIVTALNMLGGWRAWGNRTAVYPATTDPKDAWIPVRRMFNWIANSIIKTYWSRIDLPIRRVLVDDIVTSINIWFNGLTSAGALLGGRIEFLDTDNPATAIMDGKITFRIYICPPTPAQEIQFVLVYDPGYLSVLSA